MSAESDDRAADLIRDAFQVYVNESDEAVGAWLVAHYVAVLGLYRINSDGIAETRAVVTSPAEQPDYIDKGLLQVGPELLAEFAEEVLDEEE